MKIEREGLNEVFLGADYESGLPKRKKKNKADGEPSLFFS